MAADGSLKFDTAINVDGFEEGISTLSKAMDRLGRTVGRLTDTIAKRFQETGGFIEQTGGKADQASEKVIHIAEAAKMAAKETSGLEKQMEGIHVSLYDGNTGPKSEMPDRSVDVDPSAIGYDKSAMEFIERYGTKMGQAQGHANEFRQEIGSLQAELKGLEKKGMYVGDEEYDAAYLKLAKVKQALADYKKEMLNPAESKPVIGEDTLQGRTNRLQAELRRLSEEGRTFGDSLYDSTYAALDKAKAALKEYRKNLTSPNELRIELDDSTIQGKIESLKRKLEELKLQGKTWGDSSFDATYQSLTQAQKELREYQKGLASGNETRHLQEIAQSARISSREIAALSARLAELKARQKELSSAGLGAGYAEYDNNTLEIQKASQAIKQYQAYLRNLNDLSTRSAAKIGQEGEAAGMTAGEMSRLASEKAKTSTENKKLGDKADETSEKVRKEGKSASRLTKLFGMASKSLSRIGAAFTKSGKQARTGSKGMSAMLGRMILFSMVHKVISGIGRAFTEGIQNYAGYSQGFNAIMSSFVASLNQLKNSFAAAFSPITSAVIPILDALVQKIIQVINVVGQMLAALTGKGTFVRAVKVNKDYAAGLKATGGAANAAGKDAKKALAPFDDLVQIQEQGSDASGGGGTTDPSRMFEEAPIESGVQGFAEQIRAAFEVGDYAGIGAIIGNKINEQIAKITEFIDWENCGVQITAAINGFTALFNSLAGTIDWYAMGIMLGAGIDTLSHALYLLLTGIDWELLGSALGDGLNGLVDKVDWDIFGRTIGAYFQANISGLYGFVTTADWPSIGTALGDGLNGVVSEIDWEMLGLGLASGLSGLVAIAGEAAVTFDWSGFGGSLARSLSASFRSFDWAGTGTAISDIVIGLLDALIAFLTETDWQAFGNGLAEALVGIDWLTIASRLYEAFGAALGTVFGFLAGLLGRLISEGVEAAKDYFDKKIEECGGNVVLGILKGIADGFIGIKLWIVNHIYEPFIDGFLKAFGISGGTSALEKFGKDLWDGFCKGIKAFFAEPGSFIKQYITDPFVKGIKSLLGIHSPSTVLEGIGGSTVSGFNQGVEKGQGSTQTVVQSWAKGVSEWFASKLGISTGDSAEAKKWANSTMSGFNNALSKNYKDSRGVMETWAEGVREWFVGTDADKGVNEMSWTKFAETIIKAFRAEMETKYMELREPMETWARSVREWFVDSADTKGVNEGSWTKFANDITKAFAEGITSQHTESREPMETWARSVRTWFWGDDDPEGSGGMYDAFHKMAKRINEGFAKGIDDFSHLAKSAIRTWAQEVMEEAEGEFDIHSPSKEFYMIAKYAVTGFNDALADLASSSVSAAQAWLNGVLGVFDGIGVSIPVGLGVLPNASSYLPRMAMGVVAPPRAGEFAPVARNGGHGQEEAMGYLVAKMDEMTSRLQAEGNRPIQIVLNLTGSLAALARVLKPELDKEAARKGVSLIIMGGN